MKNEKFKILNPHVHTLNMFLTLDNDCIDNIWSFMGLSSLSSLSNVMQCNHELNYEAMVIFGNKYDKKIPTGGLMYMSRSFNNRQFYRLCSLLPGSSEYAMKKQCQICGEGPSEIKQDPKNPRIFIEYGFVAHEKCVRLHEIKVYSPLISLRMRKTTHLFGCVNTMVSIKREIPGVFPKEYALEWCNAKDYQIQCRENLESLERIEILRSLPFFYSDLPPDLIEYSRRTYTRATTRLNSV